MDFNTRQLSSNFFTFKYGGHQEFKGKSISIPIWEAEDPFEENANACRKKVAPPDSFLKIHPNPMIIERNGDQKNLNIKKMVGCRELLEELILSLQDFFSKDAIIDQPFLAAIRGEIGSGKTYFARSLIEDLNKISDFQNSDGKMPVFTSSLNADTQLQFLNIWQPILKQMFSYYCKVKNFNRG